MPLDSFRASAWLRSLRAKKVGQSRKRRSHVRRRGFQNLIENLEPRILLHASAVLDAEHLAVFGARNKDTGAIFGGLAPDSSATYISIASNVPEKWSDSNTWRYVGPGNAPSPLPGPGANVIISMGSIVIVDQQFSVPLHTIRDDGILRFDPHANTSLAVDTLLVEPEGTFQMGTDPSRPDPLSSTGMGQWIDADKSAKVEFTDTGPIDLNWDPLQFSRGLVSHGEVSIFGSTVTSFVQLAVAAKAHDKTLVLDSAQTGWKPSDRLIISGDTAPDANGVNHDEEVQIVSIAPGAGGQTVVTITDPNGALASASPKGDFNLDHTVSIADVATAIHALTDLNVYKTAQSLSTTDAAYLADANGDGQIDNADVQSLLVMLAQSTAPQSPDWAGLKYDHPIISGYVADVTRNAVFESQSVATISERGHVMFMHNDDVHVDGAGFYGLGRTDKRIPIDDTVTTPVLDSSGQQVVINGVPQIQVTHIGTNPRGRYAVHFHRTGVDEGDDPATISDSAVVDAAGWGIVNHSSNVDVDGNVVFNAVGAAYVTEAGDEIGRFDGNIALHSIGSGEGTESRSDIQDFGHEGVGIWLQGGNVSVVNNVVAGQRNEAYAFYAVGLNQPGLGVTGIPVADLADPSLAPPNWPYPVVDVDHVPLRQFENNLAFASGAGLILGYTFPVSPTIIDKFTAFDVGIGVASHYMSNTIFRDVTITGNVDAPKGVGFYSSDGSLNLTYENVSTSGLEIGIDVPGNGPGTIIGGFFNDVKGVYVQPGGVSDRAITIAGARFGTLTPDALAGSQQFDVFAVDPFISATNDVTKLYDESGVRPSAITIDGQQLYFPEQAADYVPFSSIVTPGVPIPAEFVGKSNAQLFAEFGLTIGGFIAPESAAPSNPRINGLLGSPSTSQLPFLLLSAKYVPINTPYSLSYAYYNPSDPSADIWSGNVVVNESTETPLHAGWNLITRSVLGKTITLLVFGDTASPTFVLTGAPALFTLGDIAVGQDFAIYGTISDDSFGTQEFGTRFRLNDTQHVSPVQTDSLGNFVTVSFTIQDGAGNAVLVNVRVSVIDGGPQIIDPINPILISPFPPSVTFLALRQDFGSAP